MQKSWESWSSERKPSSNPCSGAVRPRGPMDLPRAWMKKTQAGPLFQALTILQHFFQLQPLESATQLSVITRTSHHFLSFTSYYQSTMNSQICQNYSTRVEAAVITWSTCICGPPIPTSLWGSVLTTDLWLWRVWPNSSANWPRRSMRTWKVS